MTFHPSYPLVSPSHPDMTPPTLTEGGASLLIMKSCCGQWCSIVLSLVVAFVLVGYRVFRAIPSSHQHAQKNLPSCSSRKSGKDILLPTDDEYLTFSTKLLSEV